MSQKLCADCKKLFEEVMCPNEKISRWVHCHHEEEKKGCKICNDPSYLYVEGEIISDGKADTIEVKFCPNCGRKL